MWYLFTAIVSLVIGAFLGCHWCKTKEEKATKFEVKIDKPEQK